MSRLKIHEFASIDFFFKFDYDYKYATRLVRAMFGALTYDDTSVTFPNRLQINSREYFPTASFFSFSALLAYYIRMWLRNKYLATGSPGLVFLAFVIGTETKIVIIVVLQPTWEADHSPGTKLHNDRNRGINFYFIMVK